MILIGTDSYGNCLKCLQPSADGRRLQHLRGKLAKLWLCCRASEAAAMCFTFPSLSGTDQHVILPFLGSAKTASTAALHIRVHVSCVMHAQGLIRQKSWMTFLESVQLGAAVLLSVTLTVNCMEFLDSFVAYTGDDRLGVIRYLREQNEVAEAKLALTEAEQKRWQQQASVANRNARHLQAQLDSMRQQSGNAPQQAGQHEALSRALEQNQVLTESNKALRCSSRPSSRLSVCPG